MNIFQLLKKDHETVSDIFAAIQDTTDRAIKKREQLLEQLKQEIVLHEQIEEKVLYPVLKQHAETKDITLEAYEEHHVANTILAEVEALEPSDERWLAKVTVLQENIKHHVKEEEGEMFSQARKVLDKETIERMTEAMLKMKEAANPERKAA